MATSILKDSEVTPMLEVGDCLTRDEFERRYHAMPNCKKAELIEGAVFMPSTARLNLHSKPHGQLMTWLGVYTASTPGVISADNATNRIDLENELQPDCMMFIDPACGGNVRISDDDYVEGAAEFVAEIATSSVSYDRGPKLRTYRRAGVKEYLVWCVKDSIVEWNVLRNGTYEQLAPNESGVLCSENFPGLWLDPVALLGGDMQRVLSILQDGLATHEHQNFIAKLNDKRR